MAILRSNYANGVFYILGKSFTTGSQTLGTDPMLFLHVYFFRIYRKAWQMNVIARFKATYIGISVFLKCVTPASVGV